MVRKAFQSSWLTAAIGIASLFVLVPFTLLAGAVPRPLTTVQTGTERALNLIQANCRNGESVVLRHHRAEIERIVRDYCDFTEMAMRALGPNWKQQPPAKQQEFVRLFEDMIISTYIDRVDTYACGDEKVVYDEETIDGSYAVVKSRVTNYKGTKDVAIEYRLRLKNNEWGAYDVVIEGVSLVNNYRQQFNAILARESFDGLLQRMRTKVAEIR
jgi:phospholipid transport system substrate-binding protein